MTRRRSGAPRRWAIIASALVATAVVGLAVADAAQLSVAGSGVFAGGATRCTNGPIAVTPATLVSGTTYSAVSLSGLTGCNGLNVQFTLFGAANNVVRTGSGSAGANPLVISTTNYDAATVTGVALLVGTWGVPATWTSPACQVTPIALTPNDAVGNSGKYRDVRFASVNASCLGRAVVLTFSDVWGTNYTVSGPVSANPSFTLSTGGQYRPSEVVVSTISLRIGGYPIPYTWTP